MAKKPKKPVAEHVPPKHRGAVRFVRYAVRHMEFEEVETDQRPTAAPDGEVGVQMGLQAATRVGESDSHLLGELLLDGDFTCDPRHQPYHIRVVLSGQFVAEKSMGQEKFGEFLERNAPAILFPYMRACVAQLTSDAMFGPLRLDLVNITAALEDAKRTQQATSASSE